ncbi:ribonuclease H-like domain-containing protein [Tanacetum coccineum]
MLNYAFVSVSRENLIEALPSSSALGSVQKLSLYVCAKSNVWTNNGNKRIDNVKKVGNPGNTGNNRGPNPNLQCTNCGKFMHNVDRCFDIIGYPSGYNKNSGPKSNGPRTFNANSASSSNKKGTSLSFTNEQMLKLMNLINDAPSGSAQANMVGHLNGSLANIKYVGSLKLSEKIVLFDVLVVPEYCDLHQNKIMGTGSENGGLCMFDCVSPFSSNYQHIGKKSADLNFTKNSQVSPCDNYYKAKQTREPFPFSDHRTTTIGELIHLDLCGPYKVVSKDGFRYFLTIVDDYTRLVWIYLIKTKDEVCDHFVNYINLILNQFKLPSFILNGKSPFELVYDFKPKLSHLRSFGCLCFSSVLNNPDKFSASLQNEQSGLNDSSDKSVHDGNFFDERISDTQTSISPNDDGRVFNTPNDEGNAHPCISNADDSEGDFATSMGDTFSSEGHVPSTSGPMSQRSLHENISQGQLNLRRSSRSVEMPAKFNDYVVNSSKKFGLEKYVTYLNLNFSNYCFSTSLNKSFEPNSYSEAVKNHNWIEAINNEIEALNRNNTWTICDLPSGRKRGGFDYLETFSPVVKMSTVRCMLNVDMCNHWDLFQLDINNAFFYGDLSKDVYMTLLPGFDNDNSKVCKLNKSLYGLKQAPRSDNVFIVLLVYVDDIVIICNDLSEIEKFKKFLKFKFQIKDLGKLKYFMGIEVLDNKDEICLSQRKYCLELFYEFGLLATKHIDTPLPENATLNYVETEDDHLLVNVGNYQKLVGKLIYVTNTKPIFLMMFTA